MTETCILICHPSHWIADDIEREIRKAFPFLRCKGVSDLTDAYDYIEHKRPKCLIIAPELAVLPEFELLCAMLNQMRIGCIVWGDLDRHATPAHEFKNLFRTAQSSSADFHQLLKSAIDPKTKIPPNQSTTPHSARGDPRSIILIGASTGGVDALTRVLTHFSQHSPPTLIVQHTGGRFAPSLIRLLDRATSATVVPANEGQLLETGHVYLSPGDHVHLRLSDTTRRTISLRNDPVIMGHRPSVDALFRSALPHAPHVMAALLTGMGQDGARGLKALRSAGAQTIVQDEATCVVYGMPRIAAEMDAAMAQLPIDAIGPRLLGTTSTKVSA